MGRTHISRAYHHLHFSGGEIIAISAGAYEIITFITLFIVTGGFLLIFRLIPSFAGDGMTIRFPRMFLTLFAAMLFYLSAVVFLEVTVEQWHVLAGLIIFLIFFFIIEFEFIRNTLSNTGKKILFPWRN